MAAREQMSTVDTAWLRMEDSTNLMMVTGLMEFERPLEYGRLKAVFEERLLRFRRFRQRVREAPLGLGLPRWEDDPYFDIDAHLHRIALPAPGDHASLQTLVSDLMSTPLDYSKPLWQIHLVEGFRGGSALITRVHHCIADGIALVAVLLSLTDEAEAAGLGGPKRKPSQNFFDLAESVVKQGSLFLSEPRKALEMGVLGASGAAALARITALPPDTPTVFRGPLGPSKRAAWSEPIPLERVKEAGKRLGGTVNDVLVTAAAGALRRYLVKRRLPVDGLEIRAAVPVNLRPLDRAGELGNRFGLVFLPLPLGIASARERFAEVKRRMDDLKGSPDALVAMVVLNTIGSIPKQLHPMAIQFFGSKVSMVLTNVPGPKDALHMAGSKMTNVMFWVPQSGRVGLGLSILSYAGGVMVGVNTDAYLVSDPENIVKAFDADLKSLFRTQKPPTP